MSVILEKNMVIEGPLWPEPVRVLSVEHFGTMLQVDAAGHPHGPVLSRHHRQGPLS